MCLPPAYDVTDGCKARVYDVQSEMKVFTMICGGNCDNLDIQLHSIAGSNVDIVIKDPVSSISTLSIVYVVYK